ncbi:MAG TPA: beta-ketoacyl-[acyl-carrier-protein] synthase family protein [Verrucomicrobiae bacterium]|nr:beta-ketoacyl-[acyl-carrier-protein] synthase family protein [Verrucomicrobiae bacterium]
MREPEIVIAGCGAVSAVGWGVKPLLDALKKNSSGLRACERFNSPKFQSHIVGAVQKEWRSGILSGPDFLENPAWCLAGEALAQACASTKEILAKISSQRIALVLSTTKANIPALERLSENLPCGESARRHLRADLLAEDLAKKFGAGGTIQTVSLACVSGLVAISQAAKAIQRGEADAVFVVGVDCLSEFVMSGFTALKALDPTGCRPFDANRCGLSPGEAGAAIVLARRDISPDSKIKIAGFGGSNDANHLTGPSRDGSGLAAAIRRALDSAKISAAKIDFVHAHGTGTGYNDTMESLALKLVFGENCPPMSGSKGMLGHTLGAAGVIETVCCVLAMQNDFLPGTPRMDSPADGVPKNILREPRAGKLEKALKLNTGFGGVNGALILSNE